jgi:hypothetical protein
MNIKLSNPSLIRLSLTTFVLVALFNISCCVGAPNQNKADDTIYVDVSKVVQDEFLGVGVQWSSYPWWDVSDQDWEKIFTRVEYMRLPFVRVMLDAFWYCTGIDEKRA